MPTPVTSAILPTPAATTSPNTSVVTLLTTSSTDPQFVSIPQYVLSPISISYPQQIIASTSLYVRPMQIPRLEFSFISFYRP